MAGELAELKSRLADLAQSVEKLLARQREQPDAPQDKPEDPPTPPA